MESRTEQTMERHDRGMNCAQAVACTYCDLVGLDEETAFKATEALGLGMGGMNGTCGAVSGACVILGAYNSSVNLARPDSKAATYKLSRELTQKFLDKNGALSCRELKGVDTGKVLRSCPDCIKDAAAILEEMLDEKAAD